MKLFISWSGPTSNKLAEELREWLPNILQAVRPWVSSEDIRTGKQWLTEISSQLDSTSYGILCLTPDAVDAPWLNFEAGALSKRVKDAKTAVVGLLFGLEPNQVRGPVSQFQNTPFSKEGMLRVVTDINAVLDPPVDPARVKNLFEKFWDDLNAACEKHLKNAGEQRPVKKTDREVLDEILARLKLHEDSFAMMRSQTAWGMGQLRGIISQPTPKSLFESYSSAVARAGLEDLSKMFNYSSTASGEEVEHAVAKVGEGLGLSHWEVEAIRYQVAKRAAELRESSR